MSSSPSDSSDPNSGRSSSSSWNPDHATFLFEETGIKPLPSHDQEVDGHLPMARNLPVAVQGTLPKSSSTTTLTSLTVPSQRHVTPAVQGKEANNINVLDVPRVRL